MNLLYGEIVSVSLEDEMRVGKVRVHGALRNVLLDLINGRGNWGLRSPLRWCGDRQGR